MVLAALELELYMQTLLDTYFHFDWWVQLWLRVNIMNDEFLFKSQFVVVLVDNYVNVVPNPYHYAIVCFELLFNFVKREVVSHIIS